MPEVPATVTPASMSQLREALAAAGPDLSAHQLALLLAHVAIETRNGKAITQHNIGNLIVPGSKESELSFWRPPWFAPPGPDAPERIKRLHEGMLAGKQPRAFRAFPSFEAGLARYLSRMRGRFSPMLRADTPEEFVREWRDTGYTPDLDVERTTPNFVSLYRKHGGQAREGSGGLVLAATAVGGLLWLLRKRRTG